VTHEVTTGRYSVKPEVKSIFRTDSICFPTFFKNSTLT